MSGLFFVFDGLTNLINQGYEFEIALAIYLMLVAGFSLTVAMVIIHDDKFPPSAP